MRFIFSLWLKKKEMLIGFLFIFSQIISKYCFTRIRIGNSKMKTMYIHYFQMVFGNFYILIITILAQYLRENSTFHFLLYIGDVWTYKKTNESTILSHRKCFVVAENHLFSMVSILFSGLLYHLSNLRL